MSLPEKTPAATHARDKRALGQGVFHRCDGCGGVVTVEERARAFQVCEACGHHHPLAAEGWRHLLLDEARLEPWDEHLASGDPLGFDDGRSYAERVARAGASSGCSEAVTTGAAAIEGLPVAFGGFVFAFMGGSMGSVVGERLARLFERAAERSLPVVLVHASGGARMQEGILSLMQMAKVAAALGRYRAQRLPYLSVLVHPTTGGVAASSAFLGDVVLAEPGALIGFAGPRVIETTLRTALPEGFQRADFLLAHGMVDRVVPRSVLRAELGALLRILVGGRHRGAPS